MTHESPSPHDVNPGPGRRRILWFLTIPVTLCLFGAVTFFLRAESQKKLVATTQAMEIESVSVIHAQASPPETELALPATLQAFSDSPVYARTDGYVKQWYADIGTHVHQGQLLALIESPEIDQQLNQARAALAQAQATLKLADITASRYQGLINTDAVSQQDVDVNNQNFDAQKANTEAAKANVSRLEQMQGFEKVVAPFDGTITQRLTDIGDLINAGNSGTGHELFHISRINVIRAYVTVPETYSQQIIDGMKATVQVTGLAGQPFTGRVIRNSHSIATTSHTLLVEIDVPNPTGTLMPGAYAEVHVHVHQPVRSMLIPGGAVLYQAAGPQVAVVNRAGQVELREVALGRDFGTSIEITNGINASDAIIASPPDYLVNGMKVSIQATSSDQKS
ncbi:MAG: efflux RND transporter periplasmic adaptor subunit [Candidatus Korobacteraceae bacterium]